DFVSTLHGIGEKRAKALNGIGIFTVSDLLKHFPRDYDDRTEIRTVSSLVPGSVNTIRGAIHGECVSSVIKTRNGGRQISLTKAQLRDKTGILEITWFNQPYLKKYFLQNHEYIFTGKVTYNFYRQRSASYADQPTYVMESPDYEKPGDGALLSSGRIVPLYPAAAAFSQKLFRSLIKYVLDNLTHLDLPDALPVYIKDNFNLCSYKEAVTNIHFPENDGAFFAARRRLVFEELFFMQYAMLKLKGLNAGEPAAAVNDTDCSQILDLFPFALTDAQKKVTAEIVSDLASGRRMSRLVQGDVGSGKTAVAIISSFLAIKSGGNTQAAIMAPTEVLAEQHYKNFSHFFSPLGYKTVLLTGGNSKRERAAALEAVKSGEARMIVGTHALIQETVAYSNLVLVITDEQHRFGVNQRICLSEKGVKPHVLVMTATPIPRTLGLILYGDMDISTIDSLPPGRQTIKTYCVNGGYRERIISFMQKEAGSGRQVYVICPAIEESVSMEIKSVNVYTEELQKKLPDVTISALHGKMTPAKKLEIMEAFKANEIQILISTTVVEVGVHVANANLMVIEDADRFGLSQLHQLRGRVGRGDSQSHCVLVTDSRNETAAARMKALTETSDGFALSELDLKLRGPGEFFGTAQHGLPNFTIANLYRDMDILKEAQEAASFFFADETRVSSDEIEAVKNELENILVKAQSTSI
ncbi:MAG: ATP-dependent DNA helicase RecG, partial [Defluviitaleaceae bacterium]|nr:ATP-dependent DNA helicase RecG [Defluviitaleaceae bacterium]